ncbi:MAG: argininosuccinate lyase [Actinomycetota bacterium]
MTDNVSQPLWHGRFSSGPAEELLAFTESLSFDKRLWKDDIAGSLAHVKGLGHAGILPQSEVAQIATALQQVAAEFLNGTFQFVDGEEDIHTSIERRVTQIAGPVGGKVHTGRSRNDQCVTALRLWTKRELGVLAVRLIALCEVLTHRADLAGWGTDGVYLPGYTHVQRAQPVLLAHHLMAHAWAFTRDIDRLIHTMKRADVSPLGAGALAGSSLPLDPDFTASEMGFADRFANSLDAVSDRDFVAEALFDLALIGTHLSRIGEEWVLWMAELARGKAGRLIGNLTGLLTTLKGLPLAYNRDLQEDKEPLFDSYDQVSLAVGALTGMIQTATFNADRMRAAADVQSLSATDLAEYLVRKGVPFRQAHAIVGALVQEALSGSQSLQQLVASSPEFDADAQQLIGAGVGVQLRSSPGAAGPLAAEDQRARFAAVIASLRTSLAI